MNMLELIVHYIFAKCQFFKWWFDDLWKTLWHE